MCGICGVYGSLARAIGPSAVREMTATMTHRGPDDEGFFSEGPIAIGMRRLSIIDVAGGAQPQANEQGTVVVVLNGEIYNYRELREELAGLGHSFRTTSDTEVLVHLYEQMGDRFVARLRGMFTLALWDRAQQRLLLARDRAGIKPLYLARVGDGLAFASEIKALLSLPAVGRAIDPTALGLYLDLMYVPGRQTVFAGIERLMPGEMLVVEAERIERRAYWELRPRLEARGATLEQNSARVRAEIDEAVRGHMVADVPVGALLSGGLDSSILVALAAGHAHGPLKTYTVAFDVGELSAKYDERGFARLVAERYGTDHTEVLLTGDELARLFPRATWHLDEPLGNPTALSIYAVSRAARESVKVVLAGNGGDELFGGYLRYAYDRAVSLYQSIPGPLRRGAVRPGLELLRRAGLLRVGLGKLDRPQDVDGHVQWNRTMSAEWRELILTPEWRRRTAAGTAARALAPWFDDPAARSYQDAAMRADLMTWIPDEDLMKTDKMTMMASLELRVPLLDHRVVELAAGIPFGQKVRLWPLETKRILKHAFRDLLPPEIVSQRKRGFFTPAGKWLRTDLREMALDLLAPERLHRQGIFEPAAVQQMLQTHLSREGYFGHELWTLLSFQQWYDTFIAPAAVAGPLTGAAAG
jgi:asparagine synthase (glutamine-hydrolysing)